MMYLAFYIQSFLKILGIARSQEENSFLRSHRGRRRGEVCISVCVYEPCNLERESPWLPANSCAVQWFLFLFSFSFTRQDCTMSPRLA